CSFNDLDLLGATGPAVAHATTIVMGGKKGWPGVKDWTGPTIEGGEILVFKWDSGLFGRKHSVTIPGNASSFTTFLPFHFLLCLPRLSLLFLPLSFLCSLLLFPRFALCKLLSLLPLSCLLLFLCLPLHPTRLSPLLLSPCTLPCFLPSLLASLLSSLLPSLLPFFLNLPLSLLCLATTISSSSFSSLIRPFPTPAR
ncbi:unnamed protein product, partial [Closterium sp. NIES-64]